MKIAYRIVTPILAAGALVMGFLLDMFSFSVQISDKLQPFGLSFTLVEAIQKLAAPKTEEKENAKDLIEIIRPMLTPTVVFFVFFILAMLIMVSLIFVGALTDNKKPVYFLCGAGIVSMLVCVVASNAAFDKLLNSGEINLGELLGAFTSGTTGTLATLGGTLAQYLSNIKLSATLSVSFYAMFGIFLLMIIWCIVAGFVDKSPITRTKKDYRRKKPMRKIL